MRHAGRASRSAAFRLLTLATAVAACSVLSPNDLALRQSETLRHLVILYTNDEHGWMEPYPNSGGAAGMARLWKWREGLGERDDLLVLSGGDMWTGPALSSALGGESMADVLNAMGYQAAAIGNHDFDYGLDNLEARRNQSAFPFLAANLRDRSTGELPSFASAFALIEVNGIRVGVVGLTTVEARIDTKPAYVGGLDFLAYPEVLPATVAQARAAGAQLVLLIGHLCVSETRALAPLAADLGIPIIGGGHCHEEIEQTVEGVLLVESGYFLRGYKRIELLFDTELNRVVELRVDQIANRSRPDPATYARIEGWRARTDPALWEVIGYADRQINRDSPEMAALLLDPWLAARPAADVALADIRYIQQDLYPGPITPASIWGLLPTVNQIVEVQLSGAELIELVEARRPLVAGLAGQSDFRLRDSGPLDSTATYRVLVSDSLYAGGNYFELFRLDPDPSYLNLEWRLPSIEWIRSLASSRARPIGEFLTPAVGP